MRENIGCRREKSGSKELYVMEKLLSFILLSAWECMCGAGGDMGSIPGGWGRSGWEDPLEEEMATHSSIFAWKILVLGKISQW